MPGYGLLGCHPPGFQTRVVRKPLTLLFCKTYLLPSAPNRTISCYWLSILLIVQPSELPHVDISFGEAVRQKCETSCSYRDTDFYEARRKMGIRE